MPNARTSMHGRHAVKPTRGRWRRHVEYHSPTAMRDPAARSAPTFPRWVRITHATSRNPARCIPGSVPVLPTRGRTVWRCRGLRVPKLGESRKEFVLRSANCAKRMPSAPPCGLCLQRKAPPSGFPFDDVRPAWFVDPAPGRTIGCRSLMLPGLHCTPDNGHGARQPCFGSVARDYGRRSCLSS